MDGCSSLLCGCQGECVLNFWEYNKSKASLGRQKLKWCTAAYKVQRVSPPLHHYYHLYFSFFSFFPIKWFIMQEAWCNPAAVAASWSEAYMQVVFSRGGHVKACFCENASAVKVRSSSQHSTDLSADTQILFFTLWNPSPTLQSNLQQQNTPNWTGHVLGKNLFFSHLAHVQPFQLSHFYYKKELIQAFLSWMIPLFWTSACLTAAIRDV